MSYKLVYTERAIKDIQRDTKVKTRIGRTLSAMNKIHCDMLRS